LNYFTYLLLLFSISVLSQNKPVNKKQIDSLLQLVEETASKADQVSMLSGFSGKYRYVKNTRILIHKAIEISEETKDNVMLAKAYYSLGNFHYYNLQLDSSLVSIEKANSFISAKNNPLLKSSILNTLGGIYKKKGGIDLAISTLLKSKTILDKIDTLSLSDKERHKYKGQNLVANNTLANFYNKMGEFDTALPYYDTAYQNALKIGSLVNAGAILSNKGDLFLKMGKYEEALSLILIGKELKKKGNAPSRMIANSDLNIGVAYFKLGKTKKALSSYKEALKIYSQVENPSGVLYSLTERGILFNSIKEYEKAKKDCKKAKVLSFIHKDLEYQLKSCSCLFEAYKGLGEYEKALENHELFLKTKDSIFNEKNIKKLTQLQMQYEYDKQQEQQKLVAQKKEQQRKLVLFFAISILIIAILLGFFFVKNRNKNKQISKALEEKEILLKEIHHRVKNNLQVVSSLLSLQQRQTKDSTAHQVLQEGRNRIKAMALIHQNLYQENNLVGVDTQQYITKLANNLVATYKTDNKNIQINTNIEALKLDVDTVIPLGLIINELISNSLKYAFNNKDSGKIFVNLNTHNNALNLTVKDNGERLPDNFSVEKSDSLGFKLIRSFSQKLDAKLTVESSNFGTKITLLINTYNTK